MIKPQTMLTVTFVCLTLAACARPQLNISDGQTVVDTLSGNTVIGQLGDGTSYCEYHDANGTLLGRDVEIYAGNWGVYGNEICYVYPGTGEDCQYALVQGTRIRFMDTFSGAMVSQGNLVDGNVCN